ncbi:MAG: hypothetical protein KF683_18025 [Rubrivivax sp.]|nr:hypothetical protein [Rubrivivax sp.]
MIFAPTWRACLSSFLPAGLLALGGCAVTGDYPGDWPRYDGARIGKCPVIAGSYRNVAVAAPADAIPASLSLSGLLGLQDGDRVSIEQSPDSISVTVAKGDSPVETAVFRSGQVEFLGLTGWDVSQPRTFSCALNLPDFQHRLSFSHLLRSSVSGIGGFGAGVVGGSGEGVYFAKGTDGSLILLFERGWGALLGIVPVGQVDRFWIRFAPAAP